MRNGWQWRRKYSTDTYHLTKPREGYETMRVACGRDKPRWDFGPCPPAGWEVRKCGNCLSTHIFARGGVEL